VTDVGEDLSLALSAADEADALTLPAFHRADFTVETKADHTPVTEVDRGSEAAIRRALVEARPGDAVVGEEYGTTGASDRRWIVDPIDGTKNFVRGIPVWATLIALEAAGELVVGVVSAPALGRRWWAGRGEGARAGAPGSPGDPIRVSPVASLGEAQLSYSSLDGWAERGQLDGFLGLARRCRRTRAFGDFWSHMLVAEGACDVGLDPVVSLWDLAAVEVVVEEAGGRFTDLDGVARADGGSAVSSNGLLHNSALAALDGR
jgi:histidinol-phosphatase